MFSIHYKFVSHQNSYYQQRLSGSKGEQFTFHISFERAKHKLNTNRQNLGLFHSSFVTLPQSHSPTGIVTNISAATYLFMRVALTRNSRSDFKSVCGQISNISSRILKSCDVALACLGYLKLNVQKTLFFYTRFTCLGEYLDIPRSSALVYW